MLQSLRDGDVICISGGKAVFEVVKATEPKAKYDVTVVPATGGVQGRDHTDVNFLASELAGRLGGRSYLLHAPIFVDSAEEKLTVQKLSFEVCGAASSAYPSWPFRISARDRTIGFRRNIEASIL